MKERYISGFLFLCVSLCSFEGLCVFYCWWWCFCIVLFLNMCISLLLSTASGHALHNCTSKSVLIAVPFFIPSRLRGKRRIDCLLLLHVQGRRFTVLYISLNHPNSCINTTLCNSLSLDFFQLPLECACFMLVV